MLSKEELLKYPDYLLTKYQLEIYRQVESYRLTRNLSKTDLAKKMGVSNPYVSQILNGNFNYTLKKLIEIGLTIGQVPMLTFTPIEDYKIGTLDGSTISSNQVPTLSIVKSGNVLSTKANGDNKSFTVKGAFSIPSLLKIPA